MTTEIHGIELDDFTAQYIETAVWASRVMLPVPEDELVDGCMDVDDEHPLHGINEHDDLDSHFGVYDFTVDALRKACEDCDAFQARHGDDLCDEDDGHAGHNFWLDRNGHGTGFWDSTHYEESKGQRLSDGCDEFVEVYIYINDDGTLDFE